MFLLDSACIPIRQAFDRPPLLVGSALSRRRFRDVDVRLVLPDDEYDALSVEQWALFNIVTSTHLTTVSGLPVDFQVQQASAANKFDGERKLTLGVRTLLSFAGDAPPEAKAVTA
jgi:hypothetical protein